MNNNTYAQTQLVASHLTMNYGTPSAHPALSDVSLQLSAGESLAIMGPSGSGKTTLLHLLAGIMKPTGGDVLWNGNSYAKMSDAQRTKLRRSDFGFVFQSGQLLPELPAIENAALPLMLAGVAPAEAKRRAQEWLVSLGLQDLLNRRPGELSGGQAQRVAIARAMAIAPGVIFADEPTGALDQRTGMEVMQLLTRVAAQQSTTLIVVTHDARVASFCSRTVTMQDGRLGDAGLASASAGASVAEEPANGVFTAAPAGVQGKVSVR
ncbi:MAG: ABC transporter ATP-binding protein [Bifidobacteriaceae bacterium]|jgi:putative ABC transport system ATP-binding protein|nr:ABC transporter ATP-binding protein [Bifidobacteriaceae bacterium]